MDRPFQRLDYDDHDGIFCVRIRKRLTEDGLEELSAELGRLLDEAGCRKMVLSLGPGDLECLYSVLLAKLVGLQRRLAAIGGILALADLSANSMEVFRITGLNRHFQFYDDAETALAALREPKP